MPFEKKSKEEWDAIALEKEATAFKQYTEKLLPNWNGDGAAAIGALIAHEVRLLRQELRWVSASLKKLVEAPVAPVKKDDVPW